MSRGQKKAAKPLLDEKVDFVTFVKMYNVFLNSVRPDWPDKTPRHHIQIAEWAETHKDHRAKLLFCFRGAAKSSMIALLIAWRLYMDPTSTHIMLSATDKLASKNANNVKEIIQNFPLTRHLVPANESDMWRKTQFNVNRAPGVNEYSVMALSLQGDVTGHRCQHLYADDLETAKNTETAESREQNRTRREELELIALKTLTFIGTPHASREESMYTPMLADDSSYVPLIIPVYTVDPETGEKVYAWPEMFGPEKCADLERKSSAKSWQSQMLLDMVSLNDAGLPVEFIGDYSDEIVQSQHSGGGWSDTSFAEAHIGKNKLVKLIAAYDPSTALPGKDDSVLCVIAQDQDKQVYLHRAVALPAVDPVTGWAPQTNAIIKLMADLKIRHIVVETNLAKTLPADLRQAAAKAGIQISITEVHSNSVSKKVRIASALEALMGGKRFFAHTSIKETPFIAQCMDFPANVARKGSRDDFIDCAALGIAALPDIGRYTGSIASGQARVSEYRLAGRR